MNFPAHQTIKPTAEEERDLDALQSGFVAEMNALTAKQRSARAAVIAGGLRKANAFTRALAQQFVDVERLNKQAAEMQAEVDQIAATRRLKGFDPTPDQIARKAKLEEEIARTRARQIAVVEMDLGTARRKAVVEFREAAAEQRKHDRLAEAISRQTAEAEQADIDARAAQVVRGRRIGLGKASTAGEAQ